MIDINFLDKKKIMMALGMIALVGSVAVLGITVSRIQNLRSTVNQSKASEPCNGNVQLTANPSSVQGGSSVTFNISGDASTWIADTWTGGVANSNGCGCSGDYYAGGPCLFFPSKTCTASQTPGTYTWTHWWQYCVDGTDQAHCHGICNKSVTFTVAAPPSCSQTCTGGCCQNGSCVSNGSSNNGACGTGGTTCQACTGGKTCQNGQCQCPGGTISCGSSCVNSNTDKNNCGSCGNVCNASNGTSACINGSCAITCSSGYGNCDGNVANGCETSVNTVSNCGVCGNVCNATNGTAACNSGTCGITCSSGYGNCDSNATNGCEVVLNTTSNCGTCGRACTTGQICSAGACTNTCSGTTPDLCGTACTNKQTDNSNCGTCGNACTTGQVCTNGTCTNQCATGQNVCSGVCKNLQTDSSNCGTCGNACATGKVCSSGVCTTNCTGTTPDYCGTSCTNKQTDSVNCGSCGVVCPAGQTCSAGVCGGGSSEINSCWGNSGVNGRCYDCNGDGTVNALDFACFRARFAETITQ